jgi:predicted GH43/DUF377 family glycosyl hydrolase
LIEGKMRMHTPRRQVKHYDIRKLRELAGKGEWRKYSANPVLKSGTNGEWDSWTLATMSILKVGGICHMYYEGGRTGVKDFQIGHALSTDGIHWIKDPANPVLPFGEPGQWDDTETWDPFVLHENDLFKMWYGGTTLTGDRRDFQVGYCISRDGTHFEERRQISRFPYSDGLGKVADMHVVHDEGAGKYYMYYLDRNFDPWTLFRAESPNETDFVFDKADRISLEGDNRNARCPHVFIKDGTWYMVYGFKVERRAGYAVSADGLHWEAQNTSVIEGDDPEVLEIDDNFYLLFFCPSEYHMGHEPGCDIRVAMLEGNLSDLASTEPEPNC